MKKLFATTLLAASACGSAYAAPQTYNIDPTHTFARFSYSHLGLSTQLSRFDKTSGTIVFDPVAKTGSVDVTIDTKSVDTGYEAFTHHIQSEQFLDTEKFPTATFKSTHVVFANGKPSKIEGDLTIKGVTKHITLKVDKFVATEHPMTKKPVIGADASAVIKRSEFGAGAFEPAVSDNVTLSIAVEALLAQ